MKIIFLGTPEFSAIVLKGLLTSKKHEVVALVTQPDKPAGRGHQLQMSPAKIEALKHGIPVHQFNRVSKECDELKKYNADIIVTAAFGQLLRQNVLELTPKGTINVHPSLLPQYRGSSPIQWAVINGETITGTTIMKTDIGMDTGDIILKRELKILPDETAGELFIRLAEFSIIALIDVLDLIEQGKETYTPQDHDKATVFPMFNKDSGKIDFNKTANEIVNLVRGVNPWPVAFVWLDEMSGTKLKVFKASKADTGGAIPATFNGSIVWANSKDGLGIKCKDGVVLLEIIQAPNGKRMSSKDYLKGNKIDTNLKF